MQTPYFASRRYGDDGAEGGELVAHVAEHLFLLALGPFRGSSALPAGRRLLGRLVLPALLPSFSSFGPVLLVLLVALALPGCRGKLVEVATESVDGQRLGEGRVIARDGLDDLAEVGDQVPIGKPDKGDIAAVRLRGCRRRGRRRGWRGSHRGQPIDRNDRGPELSERRQEDSVRQPSTVVRKGLNLATHELFQLRKLLDAVDYVLRGVRELASARQVPFGA